MNDENSYIPKEKKSYVMYKSWNLIFLKMSDEDAGKLIKAICLYQNGEESILENPIAGAILSMMIDSFRSDNEKYEETCRKNSANGKKGGRGRHYSKPTESDRLRPQAKKADMDNDMDMDTDNDMDMDSDTDTETDTDIDPPASGSASVFYSESDEDFSAFQDMCRKENIQASGDQIENYLHEMNRKNWTDAGGQAIRNVGGHFRDWIKRHPDDSDDQKPEAELVKAPVKASEGKDITTEEYWMREDFCREIISNYDYLFGDVTQKGITILIGRNNNPDDPTKELKPKDFVRWLASNGFKPEARSIAKNILGYDFDSNSIRDFERASKYDDDDEGQPWPDDFWEI